jgi:hypothetical protein
MCYAASRNNRAGEADSSKAVLRRRSMSQQWSSRPERKENKYARLGSHRLTDRGLLLKQELAVI